MVVRGTAGAGDGRATPSPTSCSRVALIPPPRRESSGQKRLRSWAEKADIADFKPPDLRRWASTNANAAVGNPFWVERYLDHEIGGVAGTYNLNAYAEQKTYVAYAIENKVREAIGKSKIPMPPRPKE
jgi:hypothetical protein